MGNIQENIKAKKEREEKGTTRFELLAAQLEMEAPLHEVQATEKIYSANLGFWRLCLDAKKYLDTKRVKYDTNK